MKEYITYYQRDKKEIVSLVTADVFKPKSSKIYKYMKSVVRMSVQRDRRLVPAVKLRVSEIFRLRKIDKYLSKEGSFPKKGEKYLYFPLHYQPECTSAPMASIYADQLLVVQLASSLLPPDVKIYVKPHPNPSILADVEFYNKIMQCRNVSILPKNKNTYELIDNSMGVITLTGTAGWEAIVRGKPVLMFGNYFYQYAPGVYHIKTVFDCQNAIDEILHDKFRFNIDKLKSFLNVLDEFLIDGYIDKDYESFYEIPQEDNTMNTIKGYTSFIEEKENWN